MNTSIIELGTEYPMRHSNNGLQLATIVGLASLSLAPSQPVFAEDATQSIRAGKEIVFSPKKGNCLACHHIIGGTYPGSVGPPLKGVASRYANKQELRAKIWDATAANPESAMPPYGKHEILSDAEIDKVVEYIWKL